MGSLPRKKEKSTELNWERAPESEIKICFGKKRQDHFELKSIKKMISRRKSVIFDKFDPKMINVYVFGGGGRKAC